MAAKVGVIWDGPLMFTRLVEDCGEITELVTPHLLAAPFFRRSYKAVIIPGGFASPSYSSVLPALRACEGRIRRYVREGGMLLVFGAGISRPDAYDWLPVQIRYQFGFSEGVPECDAAHPLSCITDECPSVISIDGTFELADAPSPVPEGGGDASVRIRVGDEPVLVECRVGAGCIIVTSLHEYPSRRFLSHICSRDGETLL